MSIVITGASNGIGAALALRYAKPNTVLGLIARNQSRLEAVVAQCRQQGATVVSATIDVRDADSLTAWLMEFDNQHPVDLIIANAGVTGSVKNGTVEDLQTLRQILDINLYGVINSIYPLIEPMQRRQKGQIALVSSLAAYQGMPVTPIYCASKAAIKNYAEGLRGCLQHSHVQVSVICPGFVKSELSDQFPAPKLFMISAERAAVLIEQGLAKNKAVISFPFPIDLGMKLLALLPVDAANWILRILGYGGHRA